MKQEYKDFLKHVFHANDHEYNDPDYFSYRYIITKETDNTIDLELDDDFLEKPIHSLMLNLMEWDLMITRLVIGSDPKDYDDESLCMQITEIPCG